MILGFRSTVTARWGVSSSKDARFAVTLAGTALFELGLEITGSVTGIVCAMLFVSAPLYVSAAREAFDRVDPRFEGVARTLGDSRWQALRRVTLPLSWRGLLAASIVMWARAVSEFGAIIILALVVVGAAAYTGLGVDRLPSVDLPTVSVRTNLPGASPEDVESELAQLRK